MRPALGCSLLLPLLVALVVEANVTVYYPKNQGPLQLTTTGSADASSYTGAAAYNPTVLNAPPVPVPPIPVNFGIQLQNGGVSGLSIPLNGSFLGFSIEFSVSNQVRTYPNFSQSLSCTVRLISALQWGEIRKI